MYDWFIDIRSSLKARLPKSMFKAQCKIFHKQWLLQQEKEVPEEKKIVFSNKWIRGWMQEYNVSLGKPTKGFKLNKLIVRSAFLNTSKILGQSESSL